MAAKLSGTSLVVSLLLIRNAPTAEYGYYVLVLAALLLVTQLQQSFFQPPMVERMTRYDRPQRQALIGGLMTELRHIWLRVAAGLLTVPALLGLVGVLSLELSLLTALTIIVALAALRREFARVVLMSYRRVDAVFRADLVYALLLIVGIAIAVHLPWPSLSATAVLGLAALVGGSLLRRQLRQHEHWESPGAVGIVREIAPLALWSTAGGVIHWTFAQGYVYLVAATLDVTAVASIAATRLTLMPVNLLSTGIGSLMLPLVARWLHARGIRFAFRRLAAFIGGLAASAIAYFAVLWLLRDWVFSSLLNKAIEHRDTLLVDRLDAVGLRALAPRVEPHRRRSRVAEKGVPACQARSQARPFLPAAGTRRSRAAGLVGYPEALRQDRRGRYQPHAGHREGKPALAGHH